MGKLRPVAHERSNNKRDSFFKHPKPTKPYSSNSEGLNLGTTGRVAFQKSTNHNTCLTKNDSNWFPKEDTSNDKISGQLTKGKGKMISKFSRQDLGIQNDRGTSDKSFKPRKTSISPGDCQSISTKERKPFDKKKWRMQKYSKKYKLQQWEEKRKRAITSEYYKQIKTDQPEFNVQRMYEEHDSDRESESGNEHPETIQKTELWENQKKTFPKVHDRYKLMQQEKEEKKAEALKKREEREAAIQAHKKMKLKKYKKLSQKTTKGQPIMKHRMALLFEQIQKSFS